MKKQIAFSLCLTLLFCLAACGKTPTANKGTTSTALSESATVSEVDGGSLAYTAKAAYANAAGEGYNRIMSECQNADRMYENSVQHWPLFKFETAQEMQDFKTGFADALTFDSGYNEVPSFDTYAAEYDDAFFGDNTLLLCCVTASSGSYRFGVADVSVSGDTLCLYVKQLNHPQVRTADVQGWFVMAEVSKADVQNCKHFDAQMRPANYLDSVRADYDGDGEAEEIVLSYGPTSGLYTIGITVRDGDKEYSNYFLPEFFVGSGSLTVSCEVSVENGRVVLRNGTQTVKYWGAEPEYAVASFSNLNRKQGSERTLSEADNRAVTKLIGRQEFGDPYDNLNDVILTDVPNEYTICYDSGAGVVTRGDYAVKLSDADREALNGILSRYITLGVE